jgi:hypothetical protein
MTISLTKITLEHALKIYSKLVKIAHNCEIKKDFVRADRYVEFANEFKKEFIDLYIVE